MADFGSRLIMPNSSQIDPEGTTTVRARDVREMLKGANVDPKVQKILETLAESCHQNNKQLVAMASMLNQMADTQFGVIKVAERMREFIAANSIPEEGPIV